MKNKSSKTKDFIYKAKLVHGDKYDYSLVNYVLSTKKVVIKCSRHGTFKQTPTSHLTGTGCPYCGKNQMSRDEFIQKVNEIHDYAYSYSNCKYNNDTGLNDNITITCKKHGDFTKRVLTHLKGSGCPKCFWEKRFMNGYKKKIPSKNLLSSSTTGDNFIMNFSYQCGDTLVHLNSDPFKNKSEAQHHLDQLKMFVDMIDSELKDSKIEKCSIGVLNKK